MPIRIFAGLLLLLAGVETSWGQRIESTRNRFPDIQFGVFPDSLFQPEFDRKYAGHDFVYVFKDMKASVDYATGKGFNVTLRFTERGKFFTENGFGYGIKRMTQYFSQDVEVIDSIRIVVKTASGKRYELDSTSIQTVEMSQTARLIQFAVPLAEKGAVFDLQYRVKKRYLDHLPDFYLQERVPVVHAKASVINSQFFVYRIADEHIRFPLFHHVQLVDTSGIIRLFTDPAVAYQKTETIYAPNVPAASEEPWPAGSQRGVLYFTWSEFGRPRQVLETSWAFTAADAAKRLGFFDASMPKVKKDPRRVGENWRNVFFDVRNRFTFNGTGGVFPATNVKPDAAGRADINLELVRVLRSEGYEAYPALLADAVTGRLDKKRPNFLQFEELAAALVLKNDTLLLDAAAENGLPGVLEDRHCGEPALVIKEDGFFWASTDKNPVDRRTLSYKLTLTKDGQLSGTVKMNVKGTAAWNIVSDLKKAGSASKQAASLVWERGNTDVFKILSKEVDTLNAEVNLTAEFARRQGAISFSDGLDIFPLMAGLLETSPFTAEFRRQEIRMDRTRQIDADVEIKLPSGFRAPEKPESISFTIPGAALHCEVVEIRRELIRYRFSVLIDRWYFPPDRYPQVQAFFSRWAQYSALRWRIQKGTG